MKNRHPYEILADDFKFTHMSFAFKTMKEDHLDKRQGLIKMHKQLNDTMDDDTFITIFMLFLDSWNPDENERKNVTSLENYEAK